MGVFSAKRNLQFETNTAVTQHAVLSQNWKVKNTNYTG